MTRIRRSSLFAVPATLLFWATTLAAQPPLAPAPGPKPDPVFPFSNEIENFTKADSKATSIPDATLFIGSSSIRLWDIHGSFPDIATVNRGFGGATTPDVLHYYDRLKPRSAPRSIVVYVGENDLNAGATPDKVAEDVLTLLRKLRKDYPKARIVWMSIKPSPLRWTLWPKMAAVNLYVGSRTSMAGIDYLDVGKVLLAKDGLPDASLFRADGLHMNPRGYALWNRIVDAWLHGSAPPSVQTVKVQDMLAAKRP